VARTGCQAATGYANALTRFTAATITAGAHSGEGYTPSTTCNNGGDGGAAQANAHHWVPAAPRQPGKRVNTCLRACKTWCCCGFFTTRAHWISMPPGNYCCTVQRKGDALLAAWLRVVAMARLSGATKACWRDYPHACLYTYQCAGAICSDRL